MKTSTITTALALFCFAGTASAQSFTAIADLPGGNGISYGVTISANGAKVGGSSGAAGGSRAFAWTPALGTVQLTGLPVDTVAMSSYDLTGDGNTVVGSIQHAGPIDQNPFRWTQPTGAVDLPAWPGHRQIVGLNVSFDGSTISGTANNTSTFSTNPYRWTNAGYVEIPNLAGSTYGVGYGLSGDGLTVVGYCSLAGHHAAFRWSAATGTLAMGDLPGGGSTSEATGCSHDGKVIVGESEGPNGTEPFRWTAAGGMVGLGNFASATPNGSATTCSGDGSVVIGYSRNAADDYEAFVWDASHGMRSVKSVLASVGVSVPAGWKLNYAYDISYDGTVIVGTGTNPSGNSQGYVARLKKTCPGDLNQDGLINTADLTIFLGNFGKPVAPLLGGDLDASGNVNTADLTQFLGLFGHAC